MAGGIKKPQIVLMNQVLCLSGSQILYLERFSIKLLTEIQLTWFSLLLKMKMKFMGTKLVLADDDLQFPFAPDKWRDYRESRCPACHPSCPDPTGRESCNCRHYWSNGG